MSAQRDMNEHRRVHLIGGEDDEEAVFTLNGADNTCRLSCSYRSKMIEAAATDFFEALCKIRVQLWEERLIPFCYGASLNVYPSGMSRDMGRAEGLQDDHGKAHHDRRSRRHIRRRIRRHSCDYRNTRRILGELASHAARVKVAGMAEQASRARRR